MHHLPHQMLHIRTAPESVSHCLKANLFGCRSATSCSDQPRYRPPFKTAVWGLWIGLTATTIYLINCDDIYIYKLLLTSFGAKHLNFQRFSWLFRDLKIQVQQLWRVFVQFDATLPIWPDQIPLDDKPSMIGRSSSVEKWDPALVLNWCNNFREPEAASHYSWKNRRLKLFDHGLGPQIHIHMEQETLKW